MQNIFQYLRESFWEMSSNHFPKRVKEIIYKQELQGEYFICAIQLFVSAVFSLLYIASPKTFNPDMTFAPVPWFLSVYIGLIIIRILYLKKTKRFSGYYVLFSIFLDMFLLMGLIWTFHLQYMKPASFYLKAPTFMAAFIFIAMRALRFDPRFVLISGFAAIMGWIILMTYAFYDAGHTNIITKDYIEYMTSTKILLGAEIDKLFSISLVTLILGIAIARARKIFILSITENVAANDLKRFFSSEVIDKITLGKEFPMPGQAETKPLSIMFIDLRNFTNDATEMSPNEVMERLTNYQSLIVPIIKKHGGIIDKFMGDGIMAIFGITTSSQNDYAAKSFNAAKEILKACSEPIKNPFDVNIATCAGCCAFGVIGDKNRLEYTAIGDAVNLSAKLEKHNKIEKTKTLTDLKTYDLAVRQGYKPVKSDKTLKNCSVSGLTQPIDLVSLQQDFDFLPTEPKTFLKKPSIDHHD
jgi:adenylate cyclase